MKYYIITNKITIFALHMNERLKEIIFEKLYNDLSKVEIIHYDDSIWFIDRQEKYWYFEYQKSGNLWWRYGFFNNFFKLFCLESIQFELVISEWVEEVLNCKVVTPAHLHGFEKYMVEEVLNCKVVTPLFEVHFKICKVEEVLNCKVVTPRDTKWDSKFTVEEVLNCKVVTPGSWFHLSNHLVEEVLNCKVVTPFNDAICIRNVVY